MSIIDGMKKLCAVVIFFAVVAVAVAVWYSPLAQLGTPVRYYDNTPVATAEGACYGSDGLYRVDLSGGQDDMYAVLDKMLAKTVKKVRLDDGTVLVYALSPRVSAEEQSLSTGECYNIMAVWSDGNICIGTPMLSGCY